MHHQQTAQLDPSVCVQVPRHGQLPRIDPGTQAIVLSSPWPGDVASQAQVKSNLPSGWLLHT